MTIQSVLLSLILIAAGPALAGTTELVLECASPAGVLGEPALKFNVYHQAKSGSFGGYLGFDARSSDGSFFYCYGACGKIRRETTGSWTLLEVVNRSSTSGALDQTLSFVFVRGLLVPGAKADIVLNVDLLDADARKVVRTQRRISCTAKAAVQRLLDAR